MSEVDDNLNYMLGQLSLVVSEFNQVQILKFSNEIIRVTNYNFS